MLHAGIHHPSMTDTNNGDDAKDLWPSLNEAHGIESTQEELNDSWELLDGEEPVVEVHAKPDLLRRNSFSSPDLRTLAIQEEGDSDSHVMVEATDSVISDFTMSSRKIVHRFPSFRDAILTKHQEDQPSATTTVVQPLQERRTKVKPKLVVKPIKRCAHSAGDLRRLASIEEVLGETDAMDYYHRKSKGSVGRANGMKERPDEAKRKEMIIHKKNMQRARQQK